MLQQNNKMIYAACSVKEHCGELLNQVCTEKSCNKPKFVCGLCEYATHQSHQVVPLKILIHNIQKIEQQEMEGMNLIDVAMFLDRSHLDCLNNVTRLQDFMTNFTNTLNQKINRYFNGLKQQLKKFVEQSIPADVILDFFKSSNLYANADIKRMEEYINQLLTNYQFGPNGETVKLNLYTGITTQCVSKMAELTEKLSELQKEIEKKQDLLKEQFEPQVVQAVGYQYYGGAPTYTFSPSLKGNNIILSENNIVAEQKGSESNGQRFVICEPAIPKFGKFKFAFKVKKYTGWVGVGVCHKSIIQKAGFKFNYTNIGHGQQFFQSFMMTSSYLVSNNAYCWSHLQKELNSNHKSFDFSVNDVINIEVDFSTKKVTWSKNDTNQSFIFKSMDIDTSLELHPCANLCSPGDSVEIINKTN